MNNQDYFKALQAVCPKQAEEILNAAEEAKGNQKWAMLINWLPFPAGLWVWRKVFARPFFGYTGSTYTGTLKEDLVD